jgi:hypothetical protein
MNDLIELQIVSAVRELLTGKVNELLNDLEFFIPLVEFGNYSGPDVVVPVVALASCERSEKERLILLDAYSVSITFTLSDMEESEFNCYAYSAVVGKALEMNPTLGGVADRAVIIGKKYIEPKKAGCGEGWQLVITLRITVENQVTGNR